MTPSLDKPIGPTAYNACGPYAFTLIELLVTVAIIGILIAILLPSLARARESGKSAACQSNLRSLARAAILYSADYDDDIVTNAWPNYLLPYTDTPFDTVHRQTKIWTCPSTVGDPRYASGSPTPIWYGINSPTAFYYKSTRVENPCATAYFGDVGWLSNPTSSQFNASLILYYPSYALPPAISAYSYYDFAARHLGRGNVSWYDGHVSSEPPVMPPDAPAIAAMKAGSTGYLAPLPASTAWASFTSDPNQNYYFFYQKSEQLVFP